MKKYEYVILGGGPTGLTIANSLLQKGVAKNQILLIEKEIEVGGLCRSAHVDGAPVDIGGGHFLDIRRKEVLQFIFGFMPEHEWNTFTRISRIRLHGSEVDHPLEANLWQLSKADQVDYLESIAQAGCVRGEPIPENFSDWVTWKLGARIAEDYMLPYNKKIWSMDLNQLGTYWLYKLPDVSFRETLRSCLEGAPFGTLPAHGTFLYPKEHGYGEVWRRMGEALGDALVTKTPVERIDLANRTINGQWQAATIINTIPWSMWTKFCAIPPEIKAEIAKLKNISIDVEYHRETLNTPAHWIYDPDESVAPHRLLLRSNFCPGSRGFWSETNSSRSSTVAGWRHHNEFAYPVNTRGKPEAVQKISAWANSQRIVSAGRWGKWEHMNSDVAVAEALALADALLCKGNAT